MAYRLTEGRIEEVLAIEEERTDDPLDWFASAEFDGVFARAPMAQPSPHAGFVTAPAETLFS